MLLLLACAPFSYCTFGLALTLIAFQSKTWRFLVLKSCSGVSWQGYKFFHVLHMYPSRIRQIRLAGLVGTRIPQHCLALAALNAREDPDGEVVLSWSTAGSHDLGPILLGEFSAADMGLFTASPPLVFTGNKQLAPYDLDELARLVLSDGERLDEAQSPDLDFQSIYDLLRTLSQQGWLWQKGSGKKLLDLPPHTQGGQKTLYSPGVRLSRLYLKCLLRCESTGIPAEVPHSQPDFVYDALCSGQTWSELKQSLLDKHAAELEQAHAGANSSMMRDGASDDGEDAQQLHTIVALSAPEEALHRDPAPPSPDILSLEELLARALEEEDIEPDALDDARSESENGDLGEHDDTSRAQSKGLSSRVPVPPEVAALATKWGIFSIAVKRATVAEPFGSLEARCCLHKRSQLSGCKKQIVIKANTAAARAEALLTAKYWLSQGTKVQRQWMHVHGTPLAPLPPAEEVERGMLSSVPENWDLTPDADFYDHTSPRKRRRVGAAVERASVAGTEVISSSKNPRMKNMISKVSLPSSSLCKGET
eukprot:6492190-Amphidinium_carterae.4